MKSGFWTPWNHECLLRTMTPEEGMNLVSDSRRSALGEPPRLRWGEESGDADGNSSIQPFIAFDMRIVKLIGNGYRPLLWLAMWKSVRSLRSLFVRIYFLYGIFYVSHVARFWFFPLWSKQNPQLPLDQYYWSTQLCHAFQEAVDHIP